MDWMKVLEQLRTDRDHIDEAIVVIEKLALGGRKRRGRPRKLLTKPFPALAELQKVKAAKP